MINQLSQLRISDDAIGGATIPCLLGMPRQQPSGAIVPEFVGVGNVQVLNLVEPVAGVFESKLAQDFAVGIVQRIDPSDGYDDPGLVSLGDLPYQRLPFSSPKQEFSPVLPGVGNQRPESGNGFWHQRHDTLEHGLAAPIVDDRALEIHNRQRHFGQVGCTVSPVNCQQNSSFKTDCGHQVSSKSALEVGQLAFEMRQNRPNLCRSGRDLADRLTSSIGYLSEPLPELHGPVNPILIVGLIKHGHNKSCGAPGALHAVARDAGPAEIREVVGGEVADRLIADSSASDGGNALADNVTRERCRGFPALHVMIHDDCLSLGLLALVIQPSLGQLIDGLIVALVADGNGYGTDAFSLESGTGLGVVYLERVGGRNLSGNPSDAALDVASSVDGQREAFRELRWPCDSFAWTGHRCAQSLGAIQDRKDFNGNSKENQSTATRLIIPWFSVRIRALPIAISRGLSGIYAHLMALCTTPDRPRKSRGKPNSSRSTVVRYVVRNSPSPAPSGAEVQE
jgi:hypothetical protein